MGEGSWQPPAVQVAN